MTKTQLRKVDRLSSLAIEKLETSGITEAQAAELGIYSVDSAATLEHYFDGVAALVFPYYDVAKRPMRGNPTWPDFYRARYLKQNVKDFKSLTEAKEKRYVQPGGSGVHAYFPLCVDWKTLAADPTEPLLITEGELKAAKACLEGFPTIGLGGVHNFKQSKNGIFWLPELEAFNWARRKVTIAFDSDFSSKVMVCSAINELAQELQERGALVDLLLLPDVYEDDRKTGLDDFLVERNDEALVALLKDAEPLGMTNKLWNLNEQIVYVQDPGFIVVQETHQKMSPQMFTQHSIYSTESTPERTVRPNGTFSYDKVPAAPVWIRWPLRRWVEKLTYRPGQPMFCEYKGRENFNMWKGWGCESKKGDVTPWLKLVDFIFEGADKGAKEWFLDWCAYPLQYPGTKLFSSVLIHGLETGTGKTLLFYTLAKIYGDNFTKIENKDLYESWWGENRQFILGDEITGSDKHADADKFKTLITQEERNINIKFVPQFSIPDVMNYAFTSNRPTAMFIEDMDRRFFIHEVQGSPLPQEFYDEYDKWKGRKDEMGPGPPALFHWLLQRDLSKFNPRAPAFKTTARQRMIVAGKSDLAGWCHELREAPHIKLIFGQMRYSRDLFTAKELLELYKKEHDGDTKVTSNGMARALAAAGFPHAYKGMPILTKNGQGRYFIVRNVLKWKGINSVKELAKHIETPLVRS